ncbi:2-hydroxychromene-2-carboxylate isomerase [Pseudomonas sp. WS 5018]|nr:2-hydroxychromene-2-carboxylate isomerase [Pseudomonas sp. WS 5018]
MKHLDFYFDFLSPFAYLARHRLVQIAEKHGADIAYKPIDLARAKLAIGNNGPTNRELPIKLAYLTKDLERWADRYAMPLAVIKNHNSRLLNIGTFFAEDCGQAGRYVEIAYRLTWGEGGAPDDEALHRQLAREMDWREMEFLAFLQSPGAAERYEASTQAAIAKHVFGVPMTMIGEDMWWGNDRLMFVDEYLSSLK